MDPTAFDAFARSFSAVDTRRRVLGRLATLVPAAGLGLLLGEDADGRGRSHGRNRGHHPGKGKDNRKGRREDDADDQEDNPCGQVCEVSEPCCGHECCPTDGYVCCGSGAEARCCPTDSTFCVTFGPEGRCENNG